jgi:cyclophilin family peptidyl-prolyl cis-trans isomerase
MSHLKTTMKSLFLALMLSLVACQDKYPDLEDGLYAEIITNKGTMVAKLFYDLTPVTVANFVSLAEGTNTNVDSIYKGKKFYNGLIFHRVMNKFMIQGGDPLGTGRGNPGYRFKDEFIDTLRHDRGGLLSMANGGPKSNGSQFFITEVPYPTLNDKHSIFGELVIGLEIQDSISNVKVAAQNRPVDSIIMTEVNIIRKGSFAKKFDAAKIFADHFAEDDRKEKEKAAATKAMADTQKKQLDVYASSTIETLESGLKMHYITKGTGAKPKQGQTVTVNYEGYFADGNLFDSNVKAVEEKFGKLNDMKVQRGMYKPMPMQVSPDAQMIAGFKEAVASMSVGDKAYVFIPAHLAYGERGRGMIKPNTDLIFILEMVEIQ